MNKHIWENFKENAGRGNKIYKKHLKLLPDSLWQITIFTALTLSYIFAPLFWLYFAIFRDEETYARIVKDFDEAMKDGS